MSVFSPCPCVATESANTSGTYKHGNLTFRKCMMPFEDAVLQFNTCFAGFGKCLCSV